MVVAKFNAKLNANAATASAVAASRTHARAYAADATAGSGKDWSRDDDEQDQDASGEDAKAQVEKAPQSEYSHTYRWPRHGVWLSDESGARPSTAPALSIDPADEGCSTEDGAATSTSWAESPRRKRAAQFLFGVDLSAPPASPPRSE